MTDWRSRVDVAREAARKAREEADRLRDEARRVEREVRRQAREARRGHGGSSADSAFSAADEATRRNDADAGPRTSTEQSLDLSGVSSVRFSQSAGAVVVGVAEPGTTPRVVTTSRHSFPVEIRVERKDGELRVDVKGRRGGLFRRFQGVSTAVTIPSGLGRLTVSGGYGEVTVRQVECGSIEIDAGAGTIRVESARGSLRAHTGAGRIVVDHHHGTAHCDAGAGDVLIDVAELVAGEIRGNAGMGRVEVAVPAGTVAHPAASSGLGKTRVDVPDAGPAAATQIRAETGIGEAIIRFRDPGRDEDAGRPADGPVMAGAARPQHGGRRARTADSPDELRIVELMEAGRITPREAAELIAALHGSPPPEETEDEEPPAVLPA